MHGWRTSKRVCMFVHDVRSKVCPYLGLFKPASLCARVHLLLLSLYFIPTHVKHTCCSTRTTQAAQNDEGIARRGTRLFVLVNVLLLLLG